jgi:hypothetical protein
VVPTTKYVMGNTRKLESLGRFDRKSTPIFFARCLLGLARSVTGESTIAALWCLPDSNYYRLLIPGLVYTPRKDARKYAGPYPIVCHPPCGPWGKYSAVSKEDSQDGIIAISFAHEYGGIVEQPLGSRLFKEHGRGGKIIAVNQGDFGHPAIKATLLYIVAK